MLLQAWSEVRPDDWQVAIVGSDTEPYISHLKRYCADNCVQNVEFHSHVNGTERESPFHRAGAFVLPTHSEDFGNAVTEALIKPKVNQLKQALIELLTAERARLLGMRLRGQRYARDALLIDAAGPRLLEMCESALRQR